MGGDAADSLLEYARLLGEASHVDTVTVGADGNAVDAALLLNGISAMVVESMNSTVQLPENDEAVRYMQEHIDHLTRPRNAPAEDADAILHLDDFGTSEGY